MKTITNESGVFRITDTGELCGFECSPPYREFHGKIIDLLIPEGVCTLRENAFRGHSITAVKFPESLKILGTGKGGAFSRCSIDVVILPKSMELGPNAFSGSYIGKVTVPEDADPDMMRQVAHALRFVFTWDHFPWENKLMEGWPQEYVDIHKGKSEPRETWQHLTNDTGTYLVDSDGVLMDFVPTEGNIAASDHDSIQEVYWMHIPEGVTALFGGMVKLPNVCWELSFPKSLKHLGHNVFERCRLPDVILPENLELLGCYAFGDGYIHSLTIPGSLRESYFLMHTRQFKGCSIAEIRMPAEFGETLEEYCHYYCDHVTFGELEDAKLGRLCYVKDKAGKHTYGAATDQVMYRLLEAVLHK